MRHSHILTLVFTVALTTSISAWSATTPTPVPPATPPDIPTQAAAFVKAVGFSTDTPICTTAPIDGTAYACAVMGFTFQPITIYCDPNAGCYIPVVPMTPPAPTPTK